MISNLIRGERVALAGMALVVASSAQAQVLTPRWTHASDSESWVPRQVALGNDGGDVMTQLSGADLHRRLLVFGQATPVWQQSDDGSTLRQRAASAARASVHAALRDEPVVGSPGTYRILVQLHVNDEAAFAPGAAPSLPLDAAYGLEERTSGHDNLALVSTPDGRSVVAVVLEDASGSNVASRLVPGASGVTRRVLDLFGPVLHARLSDDGARLLAASSMHVCVTDLASGTTLMSTYFTQTLERGVTLSEDGTVAALGTQSTLRVYRIPSGSSSPTWTYTAPLGGWCSDLDISADGSTLVASISAPDAGNQVSVVWFDLPASNAAGTPVVRAVRSASSGGSLPDRSAGLAISADASVTAVGLWGDDGGPKPELVVWREGETLVTRTAQLPGSPQRIDLSPDGLRLVAGSKARHNSIWASGGRIDLYDVGPADVAYNGVPRRGQTIEIEIRGAPSRPAVVWLASALAATPIERPGIGTLFLDRTTILGLAPLGVTSSTGVASAPFTIPTSWPVGAPVYIQGATLQPAHLTESWVKFSVLP